MKRLSILIIMGALVAILTTAGIVHAKGPWTVKIEGNGIVSGGSLASYGVVEADIGWNFKWNEDTDDVRGHLNIVEKLSNGGTRHFKLFYYQVLDVGDPASRPILFNCAAGGGDARSVRIEGQDNNGNTIAAHFRDSEHTQYPNTVWYWVMDSGSYITNTNARLTVSSPFTMECN